MRDGVEHLTPLAGIDGPHIQIICDDLALFTRSIRLLAGCHKEFEMNRTLSRNVWLSPECCACR